METSRCVSVVKREKEKETENYKAGGRMQDDH